MALLYVLVKATYQEEEKKRPPPTVRKVLRYLMCYGAHRRQASHIPPPSPTKKYMNISTRENHNNKKNEKMSRLLLPFVVYQPSILVDIGQCVVDHFSRYISAWDGRRGVASTIRIACLIIYVVTVVIVEVIADHLSLHPTTSACCVGNGAARPPARPPARPRLLSDQRMTESLCSVSYSIPFRRSDVWRLRARVNQSPRRRRRHRRRHRHHRRLLPTATAAGAFLPSTSPPYQARQ